MKEVEAMVKRTFVDERSTRLRNVASADSARLASARFAPSEVSKAMPAIRAEIATSELIAEWITPHTLFWEERMRLFDEGVASMEATQRTAKAEVEVEVEAKFNRLKAQWIKEQATSSRLKNVVYSIPYQTIIGMGEKALPFLLAEIQTSPYYWFWALERIADENPAAEATTHEEMVAAWLEWARKNA